MDMNGVHADSNTKSFGICVKAANRNLLKKTMSDMYAAECTYMIDQAANENKQKLLQSQQNERKSLFAR
jgi:hypothetical protein